MRYLTGIGVTAALLISPTASGSPFRLNTAFDLPAQFSISGETRVRYEALDGQFRRNGTGDDQLLLFRTLVHAKWDTGPVTLGFELQDSRTYLGDDGTPLSSSITNPLDFLQAYVQFDDLKADLASNWTGRLKLGRQTLSIGSKRHIERVEFANVIKSYTGAYLEATHSDRSEFHAFFAVPTAISPSTREDLSDNVLSGDEEQWGRHIWGLHYRRADALKSLASDVWVELFVYGLEETDSSDFQTPDRSYVEPGFRLYRKPVKGQWDIDIDAAYRMGTRYASSAPTDTQSLEVGAGVLFFAAGYTFDAPWSPRIALEYYYASGDDDPNDLSYDQHERLFGSRRTDLNNTSIHGPLTPANLDAPGFRIEVKPNKRLDGRVNYHAAHLASETDSWVIAGIRDPSGQSGDFIGHTVDARARYWIIPDSLRAEVGASLLLHGEFAKNAPGAPDADQTFFSYVQLGLTF